MATATDPTTFGDVQGNFKNVYAPQIITEIPEFDILQSKELGLDFQRQEKNAIGASYQLPMVLQDPQGMSWLGESGDVQTLQDAQPMFVKQATIIGSEMNLRVQLSNKSILSSTPTGLRAFQASASLAMKRMNAALRTRIEMAGLYGQDTGAYGEVLTSTVVSGSTYNIVLTTASWAPGYWQSVIGGLFEFFAGTAIVGTALAGKLIAVDDATRTLTLNFTGYGSGAGSIAPGNVIVDKSAWIDGGTYNQYVGLSTQLSAETGDFFGLPLATYSLLKGNPYDAAGDAISKELIVDAQSAAVNRGASGNMVCIVGSSSWTTLWSADTSLRREDSSYSKNKSESGSRKLAYTASLGDISVYLHPLVKQGDAFLFSADNIHWTGASPPTFALPGVNTQQPDVFFVNTDKNSVEARLAADLAIFTDSPGKGVFISGIVN